mmetsp:Transcript_22817/g.35726  ORF Transcript_22817/g.35726 Transcript_22817/m.35726 type:complete len:178 (+) Transcript_22817:980-1513(+)
MVQVAKAYKITVITTSRNEASADFCRSVLGADLSLVRTKESEGRVVDLILDFTKGRGAEVVLDCVGDNSSTELKLQSLATGGRLLHLAAPAEPTSLNLQTVIDKQLTVCGCSVRAREAAYKAHLIDKIRRELWPLVLKGTIKPVIHQTFTFNQVPEALDMLMKEDVNGKLVCVVQTS